MLCAKESSEHLSFRKEEVLALCSIYDELTCDADNLSGCLVILVELDFYIPIVFANREGQVRFLPGIRISFATGETYPELDPPQISLECSWLSAKRRHEIEEELRLFWTNELCLFTMIDETCERAKRAFGLEFVDVLSDEVFDTIVKFAQQEELKRFNEGTYFCEICLENRKGIDCLKLPRCGHVSCKVILPKPSNSNSKAMPQRLLWNVYQRRSNNPSNLHQLRVFQICSPDSTDTENKAGLCTPFMFVLISSN